MRIPSEAWGQTEDGTFAGVLERVVMTILGHTTRSVFDRYHTVSPGDSPEATRRLVVADGHVSGHVRATSLDARRGTSDDQRTPP